MTTDPRLALLAAALQAADDEWNAMEETEGKWRDFIAAAILAALPSGWCGHEDEDERKARWDALIRLRNEDEAELARLRAIEEAARKGMYDLAGWLALARAYGWGHPEWRVETEQIIDALHVALGETPERPTDLGQQTVYSTALGRRVTRGEAEP